MERRSRRFVVVAAGVLGLAFLASPAGGSRDASPRRNGKFAISLVGRVAIMNADGSGGPRYLTRSHRYRGQYSPDWSPDGQRLMFVEGMLNSHVAYLNNIWVMRPNGRERQALLSRTFLRKTAPAIESAVWAPDGKRIAFAAYSYEKNRSVIYTVNVDRTGIRQLWSIRSGVSDLGSSINSLAWSPDGRRLAFSRSVADPRLYVMDLRTRRMRLVHKMETPSDNMIPGIEWSPDGRNLVFTGIVRFPRPGGFVAEPGVMAMSASGGEPRLVAAPSYSEFTGPDGHPARRITHAFAPTFSPDGREIAFIYYTEVCQPGCDAHASLVRARPDGRGRREVYQFPPKAISYASHITADLKQPSWQAVPR